MITMFLELTAILMLGVINVHGHTDIPQIGCFVVGECTGAPSVGFSIEDNVSDCLNYCKETGNCNYFTYSTEDDICFLMEDCDLISNGECSSCVSGDVTCPDTVCNAQGEGFN
jgi:hypothetical protein